MFPAIADGDVVEVSPQEENSTGDVVLLAGDERILAHRIVGTGEAQIITRGDSCIENDRSENADVLGRVSAVVTTSGMRAPHTFRTRLRSFFCRFR
jgi:hypothetical protein